MALIAPFGVERCELSLALALGVKCLSQATQICKAFARSGKASTVGQQAKFRIEFRGELKAQTNRHCRDS